MTRSELLGILLQQIEQYGDGFVYATNSVVSEVIPQDIYSVRLDAENNSLIIIDD